MELRPLLAGQYPLTAMGLWEITAVDARKRDLWRKAKQKSHDLQTPVLNASFIMFTAIKTKGKKNIYGQVAPVMFEIAAPLTCAQLDYILCW